MDRSSENPRARVLVLVIEADPDARARHEAALRSAGYVVLSVTACPDVAEMSLAAVVLSDVASFHWLRESSPAPLPPTVVVADDEKAGVIACLCGAAAWVRVDGDSACLLDALADCLR